MKHEIQFDFDELARHWPSPIVSRTKINVFSGGTVGEKYIANLDSIGKGPIGRFRIGRLVVYPTQSVVTWLKSRATPIDGSKIE